mgnify:CR=1 FL=1
MHNTFLGEKNGLVGGANTIALNNLFTGIENRAVRRVGKSITAWSLFWNNLVNYETSVVDSASLRVADPKVDLDRAPHGLAVPQSRPAQSPITGKGRRC